MQTIRRLTLPVDGSAAADRGVTFAVTLAQREGAFVDVCSVVDEASVIPPMADGMLVDTAALVDALNLAAGEHVAAALKHLHANGVAAAGAVLHGYPVAEIDEFVRHQHGDAVVMGTNGRAGMDRLFLGSVTMAIIRLADVPVVTVHADDTLLTGPILVAVDASPASHAALECAIARAQIAGVALQLLHVFEAHRIERLSAAIGIRRERAEQRAVAEAENALDDAAERVRAAGVPFRTQLDRDDDPAQAILAAAELHGAGAIAMGTHGRGGLERLLIGSVADRVVRAAHLPVYVVHRRNAKLPALVPGELTDGQYLSGMLAG